MYLPTSDSDFEIVSLFVDNTRGASVNNNLTRKRVIKFDIDYFFSTRVVNCFR